MVSPAKCVVWDLDNTLWNGVCLVEAVSVRPEARRTVEELDRRGILNSIASRGEKEVSTQVLRENSLDHLFLAPQINWLPKPANVQTISREFGIATEAMAFIDDDPFEREQMQFMIPDVTVFPAEAAADLPGLPSFSPTTITDESRQRRRFYQSEQERRLVQENCSSRRTFLELCNMTLRVRPMVQDHMPRVLELMSRTHQLNTTGTTLSGEEVSRLLASRTGAIHVAELTDRFGTYGNIGVAIVHHDGDTCRLEYFAVSCRVLGRGVERAFLATLAHSEAGRSVEVLYRDTGRNRRMRGLYQMMGFRADEIVRADGTMTFRAESRNIPEAPSWVRVR